MKKIALLLCAVLLFGALASCGEAANTNDTEKSTDTSAKSTEKSTDKVTDKVTDKTTEKETDKVTSSQSTTSTKPADIIISPENSIISYISGYKTQFDLTDNGTKYWEFYGPLDGVAELEQCKSNATDIITTTFNHIQSHYDNKATVVWTDGLSVPSAVTTHGRNSYNDITVKIKTADCTEAKFLIGAWLATNQMKLVDESGTTLGAYDIVKARGDSAMALVTVDLTKYSGSEITVVFTATDKDADNGNVSLTAVTVK